MTNSYSETLFFLCLYSFLGWSAEVIIAAVKDKQLVNKGFLNLPLTLPYGFTSLILIQLFSTLPRSLFIQVGVGFVVFHVVWSISEVFVQKICQLPEIETSNLPTLTLKTQCIFEVVASLCITFFLLMVHPFIHGLISLIPSFILVIFSIIFAVVLIIDFFSVIYSLKTHKTPNSNYLKTGTQNIVFKISEGIWNRLKKSYPEINTTSERTSVFAKGICFDKLVWVFLISSFFGALIEMCYCRAAGDIWMNRSSLLYGTFSVVWGAGAVLLTIILKPIRSKSFFLIFAAGFVVGGVYEYFCSVFTEYVFGTVFWDYSHMAYSIGGRTNLLYCFFWGLLSVIWIKVLYPLMERNIEKIPPLYGKMITWVIVLLLSCDSLLTCGAMLRYTQRQINAVSANAVEYFFDFNYDDEWMEHRWPNMVITAR